jgi:hypothetical protein
MADRQRATPRPTTPLCPTTPGGIPVRLLVDAEPRSRARRALAVVLLAALAAGIAVVALAGCGAPSVPRPPGAVVNRVTEVHAPAAAGAAHAVVEAPSGARTRLDVFPVRGGLAARFRPRQAGWHRWRIVEDGPGARELAAGEVDAVDLGVPGQVVTRGAALATEDGRPFHPLGENRFNVYDASWSDGLSPEAYVARMAADGMNTLRVFVFTACGKDGVPRKPGCLEPALGRFDEDAARQYDAIFSAAEAHGVKVVLGIFAIGFTPGDAWKGWEDNPYSAARGGPARTPAEFFRSPVAREGAKARLRYALARWGASPALLSVDLLNEPEWDGAVPEEDWIPWAEEMARTWRAEDPYRHPITAGPVGLHWNVVHDERPWWAAPECDLVQWHRYGPDVYDVHALADALVGTVRDTRRYGKPVLVGEFAWGGEGKIRYDHTHVGIWSTTFAGAGVLAHSAPPFSEDSDEPMTAARASHFRTLAAFLRRAEASGPVAPARDPEASVPGLRALALAGDRTVALWLHAPRAGYGAPVHGATVKVRDLAAGAWRVSWWDDVTGERIATDRVDAGSGGAVLRAPPFALHVAALVERAE